MGDLPPAGSRILWNALQKLFPAASGVLTLVPGRDPLSGGQRFWSPELSLWFPSLPDQTHVPHPLPLKAEVSRKGRDWTVRVRDRGDSTSPERILEWSIPGAGHDDRSAPLTASSSSRDRGSESSGIFRSPSDPVVESEFFHGPFPADPSLTMKPESCLLELRWPGLDPVAHERAGGDEVPAAEGVPFRLEVRFPGGETAIVGGVYESRTRFLSVSARLSSSDLAGFWNRSLPEISRDLSEVFRIRMEGRPVDEGTGGG